ncbi:MAG: ATP synthase F1 subunit epsilon [Clostridia bacterium]|nr:ATP synthase F1 subunit epsilon [Clostridia bacterium]
MNTFQLEILSPDRMFYSGECEIITVPLHDGSFGIMANHSPFTAAVVPGEVRFTVPGGEKTTCAVSQGMIDVENNTVKLLCESVLRPEEIDEENERREAEIAAEDMRGKQSYKDYMLSQLVFARAVNNLRVKKHDAAMINHK